MSNLFTFRTGSLGNGISIDASGRLVASAYGGQNLFVHSVGENGFPLVVDGSGRMVLSPFSPTSPLTSKVSATTMTFDLSTGNVFKINLSHNTTFVFNNPNGGQKYIFLIKQAVGSKTITWPSTVKWRAAAAPTLTAASGSRDVVSMLYDNLDNVYLADYGLNFA